MIDSILPDWLIGEDDTTMSSESESPTDFVEASEAVAVSEHADALARTPPPAMTLEPYANDGKAPWRILESEVFHDATDDDDVRTFQFKVANHSTTKSHECRVEFALPADVTTARATHRPHRTQRGLQWRLGVLEPGETVAISVQIPFEAATEQFWSTPAIVRIAQNTVTPALLDLECQVAPMVFAGKPVAVRISVANRGRHATAPVKLAAYGREPNTPLASELLASLAAGEVRTVELRLIPDLGNVKWHIAASVADSPMIHGTVETVGVAAELGMTLTLPESLGTDEAATGHLVVNNRCALPIANVQAALTLPEELIFRGATQQGTLGEHGDLVVWEIGELSAGAEWVAEVRIVGFAPGKLQLEATVAADGQIEQTATALLSCEVRRSAVGATLAELLSELTVGSFDDESELEVPVARDTRVRHLLFRTAGARFALPIGNVREVLRPLPVTPVPGVQDWMSGVANVRGDIFTVIELAPFLGLEASGACHGMVIVRAEGADSLGILIDEVVGIQPLAVDQANAMPDDQIHRFLAGITLDPEGVIHRLNPLQLLAIADSGAATAV